MCSGGPKEARSTLSACLRQSILRIFPFWSGFDRTHMAGFLPVMERTKSSRHSWAISFRSFPSRREAHFCFTSTFSAWKKEKKMMWKVVGWWLVCHVHGSGKPISIATYLGVLNFQPPVPFWNSGNREANYFWSYYEKRIFSHRQYSVDYHSIKWYFRYFQILEFHNTALLLLATSTLSWLNTPTVVVSHYIVTRLQLNSYRNTQLSFYEGIHKTKQINKQPHQEYLSSSDTLYECQSRDHCWCQQCQRFWHRATTLIDFITFL